MFRTGVEDIKLALRDLSEICRVVSLLFLLPTFFTLVYAKNYSIEYLVQKISFFLLPFAILYGLYMYFKRLPASKETKTKHIMMTISIAWLLIAVIGALPYILSNTLSPVDALFESMSGWTTTGMTMIEYPEILLDDGRDILFYRSLTQWIGGVGIIVLTLIVFLREGTAAIEYYSSEVGSLKIKPSIRKTIIETWKIYILYTVACIILLYLAGMNVYDAINHSLTALPTGGFSTRSDSIGYYQNPMVEMVLIVFMMVGGISFIIHYRAFEGKRSHIEKNIEFRYMMLLIVSMTAIFFFFLTENGLFNDFRISLFQTVSILTTTGFGTSDIAQWPVPTQTLLLVLMLVGGSYGSTGSGIKVLRAVVIWKAIIYSIKKFTFPKSVMVRFGVGDNPLNYDEITNVFAFFTTYMILIFAGIFILTSLGGYEGFDSLSVALSAISNVGPTYLPLFVESNGSMQPNPDWFDMPAVGKITLFLLMWVGRLEIFPVLILFTVFFRKRRGRK